MIKGSFWRRSQSCSSLCWRGSDD